MGIRERLIEINELPTLPEVVLKLRRVILSDEGNAASLGRIIENDPPLSARVLKVANSSFYYSPAGPIVSVERAVSRIGFNEVGNLAMAASIIKMFTRKSSVIDYHAFWRHSIGAAYLSSMMGELLSPAHFCQGNHDYFLAGLFHDIGILIYDQFFNKEFQSICSFAAEKRISFLEAESKIAPNDPHSSVGGTLLELWKINRPVIEGVNRHHEARVTAPDDTQDIISAVSLSELLLRGSEITSDPFEGHSDPARDPLISSLEIQREGLPILLMKTRTAIELAATFFA